MISGLLSGLGSFLLSQWKLLAGIGAGLIILMRSVKYIEDNKMARENLKNIRNGINRVRENQEDINEYTKHVGDFDRAELTRIMLQYGELRNAPE